MQDAIIREITVNAPKERVYAAITDPEQIVSWFPDKIEGSIEVGGRPVFVFTEENHRAPILVEAATPFSYFSYRWTPGTTGLTGDPLTLPTTLVEFIIEELAEGTKVTLKESGFSSLPAEIAEESLSQNSGGWEYMIGRLEEVLNKA